MDITVEAIEALRVPDAFTPVVAYKRFGIPWPPRAAEHCLVQKGHRWEPKQVPTTAECRRPGSSTTRAHATPYQGCGCGLYAFMEVEEALHYYDLTTMK